MCIASEPDTRTIPTLPCCGTIAVAIAAIVPVVAKISDIVMLGGRGKWGRGEMGKWGNGEGERGKGEQKNSFNLTLIPLLLQFVNFSLKYKVMY